MRDVIIVALVTALCALSACDKGEATPAADAPKPDEAKAADAKEGAAKAPEKPAEKADEAKNEKADAKEAAPDESDIPMEVDPNAVGSLEIVDMKNKAPEGFEIPGEVQAAFGWKDKYGLNAVVIARKDGEKSSLLTIRHATQEGDGSWLDTRVFKERLECMDDSTLAPKTGKWSITDLDKDNLGEATFAYSVGCRTDMSPVTHKVLMTENGEKWALRGNTRINPGGGPIGGDFKPDFEKAPEGFQAHAEMVWKATVDEMAPE